LKALAFDARAERKDAHDLVYCIENGTGGIEAAAASFREQLDGKYKDVVFECMEILRKHFVTDKDAEGYRKNGPVKVANFELGESDARELQILRQKTVSEVIEAFLASIGAAPTASDEPR
jgi:hypothetical protein